MPTENRSSNTEMVSVPRELLETTISYAWDSDKDGSVAALQEWLDQPAQQPQGEPVAVLYANGTVLTKADCGDVFDICCKVETPLYTHADPAEVERLRKACEEEFRSVEILNEDNQRPRAQLAEAHALLRESRGYVDCESPLVPSHRDGLLAQIEVTLSASAEPQVES